MALSLKNYVKDENLKLKQNQIIKIRNLKVNFKVKDGLLQAVRGIDLTLYKGQIIGIVGESGSGKSVSVKSLIGFNDGSITNADNLNLLNINILSIKKSKWTYVRGTCISYIPQDPLMSLNPTTNIGKQVIEAIYISEKNRFQQKKADLKFKLNKKQISKEVYNKQLKEIKNEYKHNVNPKNAKAKVIEILEFIGIENAKKRLNAFPHEFSGGMRQRIVIAIAVATRPEVIIADEPTTALDVTVQAKVLDLIKKLRDVYNISVIFISHNIALVANFCDYIYVMYAGRIVEQGLTHEIFTQPLHPYTWALLVSVPDSNDKNQKLIPIVGTPPNLVTPPKGDAFAPRNEYAIALDFERHPPMFAVTDTHKAATWLLHPNAPKIDIPIKVQEKIKISQKAFDIYVKQKKQVDFSKSNQQNSNKTTLNK